MVSESRAVLPGRGLSWDAGMFCASLGVELTQCVMGTELTSYPMRISGITRRATAEVTLK